MGVRKVIKEWMLPIAMVTGASLYLIYHFLPEPVHRIGPFLDNLVSVLHKILDEVLEVQSTRTSVDKGHIVDRET